MCRCIVTWYLRLCYSSCQNSVWRVLEHNCRPLEPIHCSDPIRCLVPPSLPAPSRFPAFVLNAPALVLPVCRFCASSNLYYSSLRATASIHSCCCGYRRETCEQSLHCLISNMLSYLNYMLVQPCNSTTAASAMSICVESKDQHWQVVHSTTCTRLYADDCCTLHCCIDEFLRTQLPAPVLLGMCFFCPSYVQSNYGSSKTCFHLPHLHGNIGTTAPKRWSPALPLSQLAHRLQMWLDSWLQMWQAIFLKF